MTVERRRLLLFVVLPIAVFAAAWLFGVAVRGASQDQDSPESREARERSDIQERIARLELKLRDLMGRHPDYYLGEARRVLLELERTAPKARPGTVEALEARAAAVELGLRARATGLTEGMDGWNESLAYKSFSPNGFRDLYEGIRFAGTTPRALPPAVIGDPAADRRIAELAAARGYRLRGDAEIGRLVDQEHHALQPEAMSAWLALRAAAQSEGRELGLVSGYRSVDRQRQIFLAALERAAGERAGGGPIAEALAAGRADPLVDRVLRESSPPGFSRHHEGYTIDIADLSSGLEFTDFGRTAGFNWIADRNYFNAKRFGFIPSYPQGASQQGPDPEPWEYVWVGAATLESAPGPGSGPAAGR